MQKRIVIFGGSFNPPGTHHVKMITPLLVAFDEVIVVPCGDRPDKPTTGAVSAADRAAMAHLAFGNIATKVRVDDFDLTGGTFMRTIDLQARYAHLGEIWHVIGTDLIRGGAKGNADIQNIWREWSRALVDAQLRGLHSRRIKLRSRRPAAEPPGVLFRHGGRLKESPLAPFRRTADQGLGQPNG